jgi:hypothetical protein
MGLSEFAMVAFANYLVLMHDYATHHWVRRNMTQALYGKVDTTLHKFLMRGHAG